MLINRFKICSYIVFISFICSLVSCQSQTEKFDVSSVIESNEFQEYKKKEETSIYNISPITTDNICQAKKINNDVIGWLNVPDTFIDSPVLQNKSDIGIDYFYLNHDFNKKEDKNGTYTASYNNYFGDGHINDLDFNTIIYAHNHTDDPNGVLFAQLKKYKDPVFAKNNPYIFFKNQLNIIDFYNNKL